MATAVEAHLELLRQAAAGRHAGLTCPRCGAAAVAVTRHRPAAAEQAARHCPPAAAAPTERRHFQCGGCGYHSMAVAGAAPPEGE